MLATITAFFASQVGRTVRFVVSLGLIAWLIFTVDWRGLASVGAQVSPLLLAAAVVTAVAAYPLCALRWEILLRAQSVRLPSRRIHAIVWIGQFYNAFLPGGIGGDAARLAHAFPLAPTQKTAVATATLTDRVCGFGVLLALALPATFLHVATTSAPSHLDPWLWAAGALGVFALLGLVALRWLPRQLTSTWTRTLRDAGKDNLGLLSAIALSAAVWLLDFFSGWLLARSIGLDIGFSTLSLALIAADISSVLPISIGGHGVREGALVFTLTALTTVDAATSTFTALALLFLAVTVFCSLLGGCILLLQPADGKNSGRGLSPCA